MNNIWLSLLKRNDVVVLQSFNNGSNNTGYYCQYYRVIVLVYSLKSYFHKWEKIHISSSQEIGIKYKIHDFRYENIKSLYDNSVKKMNRIILVLTSSLFITVHQSLLFRNEEKRIALLVYSSFVRVTTSGFQKIPYSLVVVVCAQIKSESRITPYSLQHCSSA